MQQQLQQQQQQLTASNGCFVDVANKRLALH
jgi:hypothetical protein